MKRDRGGFTTANQSLEFQRSNIDMNTATGAMQVFPQANRNIYPSSEALHYPRTEGVLSTANPGTAMSSTTSLRADIQRLKDEHLQLNFSRQMESTS